MAVLSIGLTPISPTIDVVPVVEIPDLDRTTKSPAIPRFTAVCVLALAGPAAIPKSSNAISTEVIFIILFDLLFIFNHFSFFKNINYYLGETHHGPSKKPYSRIIRHSDYTTHFSDLSLNWTNLNHN